MNLDEKLQKVARLVCSPILGCYMIAVPTYRWLVGKGSPATKDEVIHGVATVMMSPILVPLGFFLLAKSVPEVVRYRGNGGYVMIE